MNGVHTALLTTGAVCLPGALLAAIGVRRASGAPATAARPRLPPAGVR